MDLKRARVVPIEDEPIMSTDVHMEPMGGIEFVRHLRALEDESLSSIPVIFD